jgi:predicted nucleic acid-binding protein
LPDLICDTSPIQYLYQLDLLRILPALAKQVIVPPAVVEELEAGRALGVSLPDLTALNWVTVHRPTSELALPLVTDMGPGETQVLMLALESREAIAVIDDAVARHVAEALKIRLTGTLGLLLDAKRAGLVPTVAPLLDQLQALRFRLAPHTRLAVLKLAEEGLLGTERQDL